MGLLLCTVKLCFDMIRAFAEADMRIPVLVAGSLLLVCSASGQHLGQKITTASGNTVTVYSISYPNPASPVSADVEVCAGDKPTFAFPSFFQIRFVDGGGLGPYGSRKQPTFERTHLEPKQCVRGWLDYAVTTAQKPVSLHYHEAGADQKPIDWPVK